VTLEDALLVSANTAISLGTLQPGASVSTSMRLGQGNFPAQAQASFEDLYNRQEALNYLFDYNRFANRFAFPGATTPEPLDEEGVYLLGWHNASAVSVDVEGLSGESEALTLYVVRLASGGA
jgi:hypothetical protein